MELEKKMNNKFSNLNPSNMKENNMNITNMFDVSLRSRKEFNDGFKEVTKLRRNFK